MPNQPSNQPPVPAHPRFSQCPNPSCQAVFRCRDEILEAAMGMVRCPYCKTAFNALANQVEFAPVNRPPAGARGTTTTIDRAAQATARTGGAEIEHADASAETNKTAGITARPPKHSAPTAPVSELETSNRALPTTQPPTRVAAPDRAITGLPAASERLPASASLLVALRNIVRHRRRTLLSLAPICFGVIALIVASGFIDFMKNETRERRIHSHLGHIQLVREGYTQRGEADPYAFVLPARSAAVDYLNQRPDVVTVTPRLGFAGLASLGDTTLSFLAEGVAPETEAVLSTELEIIRGRDLAALRTNADAPAPGAAADQPRNAVSRAPEPADDTLAFDLLLGEPYLEDTDTTEQAPSNEATPNNDEVILGTGLAQNLNADVGDRLVLLTKPGGGGLSAVEVTVVGIFQTPIKAYDDAYLRTNLQVANRLTRTIGPHKWVVLLDRTESTDAVIADLEARFPRGEHSDLQFISWFSLADFYRKTVVLFDAQVNVIRFMIGLIIIASISNTMFMNVKERTSEIGTLMALGFRRKEVLGLFVREGLVLGLVGGTFGVILGLAVAHGISSIGVPMPPPPGMGFGFIAEVRVTPILLATAFVIGAGATVLASIYPARKAAALTIVDALRHSR